MDDDLMQWVNGYRNETNLKKRLDLAGFIHASIEGDLRLFILRKVHPSANEDVLHEALKAIVINLSAFRGKTDAQFFAWCYRIARNKANDQLRKQSTDRIKPLPEEELWRLVEATAEYEPLSPADKLDLEYAMKLLMKSKPACCDFLWNYYVIGLDYAEIADEFKSKYNAVRMKIQRCLDTARKLMKD
jgi:RNA polymerase sigma factor (sigma-70 family)